MSQRVPVEVFPPGDLIRDEIEARGWTQNDLAEILGRPVRLVNEIIAARRAITPETAIGLADAFGTSAQLWMNLETTYQLSKLKTKDDAVSLRADLYSLAPVKDMIRRGWIEKVDDPEALRRQLFSFFNAKTTGEIDDRRPRMAARKSSDYSNITPELRAWLQRVERLAKSSKVRPYREKTFDQLRAALRKLIINPQDVIKIPGLLAEHGIRFLVVEHLPKTRLDGVAFWDDRGPIIALTLRLDRLDCFWFTLVHELGHIFYRDAQGDLGLVVDSDVGSEADMVDGSIDEVESRADEFASEFLISKLEMDTFVAEVSPYYSRVAVTNFAARVGVHPGIVVGQLHNRKSIPFSQFRDMLVKVRDLILEHTITDGWGHMPAI